ncbi:MAG: hypothetical protein AMXMBFR61_03200 [Fimbriimonadales bacterium]
MGGDNLRHRQAFSLVELLVVVAVIAILAALLFPVMSAARGAAIRASCAENFSAVLKALRMYMDEYSDRFPPTNYHAYIPERVDPDDRTWVQVLYPYTRSVDVFECPGDTGRATPARVGRWDDVDAAPDDDWGEFYVRSLRTNLGFNFMYLSPLVRDVTLGWMAFPNRFSSIASPARTLVFVDSVWGRDHLGRPFGGGQWVVVPPCRYLAANAVNRDTFPRVVWQNEYYWRMAPKGWESDPKSSNYYGGAWNWHNGGFTVVFADGHVRRLMPDELTAGCSRLQNWDGLISDQSAYIWDLQD